MSETVPTTLVMREGKVVRINTSDFNKDIHTVADPKNIEAAKKAAEKEAAEAAAAAAAEAEKKAAENKTDETELYKVGRNGKKGKDAKFLVLNAAGEKALEEEFDKEADAVAAIDLLKEQDAKAAAEAGATNEAGQ